jgi:hypothetical protein
MLKCACSTEKCGVGKKPKRKCGEYAAHPNMACTVGSSDFDIFLEIQYASCVFGLALKS